MEVGKQSTIVKVKVLMLPWLGHGHTSPYLELAKRLAARNFHIYICSTPVVLKSIQNKISDDKHSTSVQLVELRLPSSPELPPHYHTTNGLPPHLMIPLKKAYEMSSPQFSDILESLRPDLVIYDFIQPWAAEIASSLGIPAVQFVICGAALVSYSLHMMEDSGEKYPHPEIYLRGYEKRNILRDQDDKYRILQAFNQSHKIVLIKTCREIEGKFIDFVSSKSGKRVVPVGPLVPDLTSGEVHDEEDQEIIAWLDQKEKRSVVYASFGREYFLTKEERAAIAKGLELSNANFIWALRFPLGEKLSIEEALPEGFLERVGHMGKIVEGWAPQAKILKHPGTGAFLSHCGWCSVMESLKWGGVPIVAMPMYNDQPVNAQVVEAIGIGVEAVRDKDGNARSEEIARVVRMVLVDESGENVRRKAKELGKKLEMKEGEEIETLVKELSGLCRKNL